MERKVKNTYSALERAHFDEPDKELKGPFTDHLSAIGVTNRRLSKYNFHSKVIGENFPTSFKETQYKDIKRLIGGDRLDATLETPKLAM